MRGNSILSKLRYYVNKEILRTIYLAMFYSCLSYVITVWGANKNPPKVYNCPAEKSIKNYELCTIYDYNILKFFDIINIEACAFINNCFSSNTFSVFAERFKLVSESHGHDTRPSIKSYFLFQATIFQDLEENQ